MPDNYYKKSVKGVARRVVMSIYPDINKKIFKVSKTLECANLITTTRQ